jgi:GMP synthase-like glutamine amidotransferase
VKPIVILQNADDDPPDTIADFLSEVGQAFEVRRVWEGDPLPERPDEFGGLITLGASMHAHEVEEHPFLAGEQALMREALRVQAPQLGICLGAHLLAAAAGGEVYERPAAAIGWFPVEIVAPDELFEGVSSPFMALLWHFYSCSLPPGAQALAERPDGLQAFRCGPAAWGVQFHPEISAATAALWASDTEESLERQRPGLAAELQTQNERFMPDCPALCRRLLANFLRATGIATC